MMMTKLFKSRSFVSRVGRWFAALAGAGLASTSPVAGQSVSPSVAPVEWVRYAEAATLNVNGWLEEDGQAATAFRAYLDRTRSADDQPTTTLVLKVWIDPVGRIERLEFTPFAHEQANADLRAAIVGRRLPSAPPRDMLLPLRIGIQLESAPQPAQDAFPTDGTQEITRTSVDRT